MIDRTTLMVNFLFKAGVYAFTTLFRDKEDIKLALRAMSFNSNVARGQWEAGRLSKTDTRATKSSVSKRREIL